MTTDGMEVHVIGASKPCIRIEIPIKTVSEANQRGHWARRAKRIAEQRSVVRASLATQPGLRPVGLLRIRLTRIAPGTLDSDNVYGALKAIRDGVADYLGVDDGDESLTWEVAQERGKPGEYAVRIEIWQRVATEAAPLPRVPRPKTSKMEREAEWRAQS